VSLLLGLLGVLGFSGSLPATRVVVGELEASFVGLGQAVVAAALGGLLLAMLRRRLADDLLGAAPVDARRGVARRWALLLSMPAAAPPAVPPATAAAPAG